MRVLDMLGRRSTWGAVARRKVRQPNVERLEDRAVPASYTAANVTQLIDSINAANATAEADTITLAAGTTFTLTTPDTSTFNAAGLPAIAAGENLTIVGNGGVIERSTAQSTPPFRHFNVAAGGSLTLQSLTLQGGLAKVFDSKGGAVFNQGTLILRGVIIQNNTVRGSETPEWVVNPPPGQPGGPAAGGGIYSEGALILESSTVQRNLAIGGRGTDAGLFNGYFLVPGGAGGDATGGGVHIAGGTVSISDSVLTSNTAQGGEGGRGLSLEVNGVPMQAKGGDGGDGLGGALHAAGGTVSVLNSEVTQNAATGGAGGNGLKSLKGAPGHGIGGGFYIDPLAVVSLDTFTVNRMRRNRASTTGDGIHGPYSLVP